MSGVVLRCPNCGTTRAASGECEACHEAQVRYYCTNHNPGRWLEGRGCSQCGAQFGEPGRPPAAKVTGASVPRPAPAPLPPRAAPRPGRFTRRSGGGSRVDEDAWGRERRPFPADEKPVVTEDEPGLGRREAPRADPRRDPRAEMLARWQEMLRVASRGRVARRTPAPDFDVAPIARSVGGFLMRLVFLVVLFIFAMVLFGGMFFQFGY
jgi:hypothetical protein